MGTYGPTVITRPLADGDPFDGEELSTAFNDVGKAINSDLNVTDNIVGNKIFSWHHFHPGALTETYSEGSKVTESFVVLITDPAAAEPWGEDNTNAYDVVDTGVDFYLHTAADALWIDGHVQLLKAKDSWNSGPPIALGFKFTLDLIIDGVSVLTLEWDYGRTNNVFENRGFPLNLSYCEKTAAYLTKGAHRAHLRLTMEGDNASAPTAGYPEATQFLSNTRGLSVVPIYA